MVVAVTLSGEGLAAAGWVGVVFGETVDSASSWTLSLPAFATGSGAGAVSAGASATVALPSRAGPSTFQFGNASGATAIQTRVSDPRPRGGRATLHELEQAQGQCGDEQRLECNAEKDGHQLAPLALRARAIICSSSSSSFSFSFSDMPSRALAALAGEPLKKVFTISLSADFLAAVSDTTGL